MKTQAVPRRERCVLAFVASQQREVTDCYCERLSEYTNTGIEKSTELFSAKPGGLSSDSNLCVLRFALL